MTEQERLAREWAEMIKSALSDDTPLVAHKAASEFILATTTPPTMEGVQWDAREHRGLGTFGEDGVEWVMVDMRPDRRIVGVSPDFRKVRGLRPEWLTPNGKRYELVETTDKPEPGPEPEPEHPKTLRTVEDLKAAPDGTVISQSGEYVLLKRGIVWSIVGDVRYMGSEVVAAGLTSDAKVLRWGWGK